MAAHFKGLGFMERYEYADAVEAFREVHRRAPGWIAGEINLAIALLNDSGVKAEQAKKAGGEASVDNFNEALELLAGVLAREPRNPYAHFCRGIILEQQGRIVEAYQHFKDVTEIDPRRRGGLVLDGQHLARPRAAGPARGPESSKRADGPFCESARAQPLPGPRDL